MSIFVLQFLNGFMDYSKLWNLDSCLSLRICVLCAQIVLSHDSEKKECTLDFDSDFFYSDNCIVPCRNTKQNHSTILIKYLD